MLPPGVFLERRRFLQVSAAVLGALWLGRPGRLLQDLMAEEAAPSPVGDLLTGLHPMSKALTAAETPDEEAYLAEVAKRLKELKGVPAGTFGKEAVDSVLMGRKFPVMAYQFRLLPGAVIPHHDHKDYNGAMVVLEGEFRVASFEAVGALPPKGAGGFRIRRTREGVLKPGEVSSLSRVRDNIHELEAGKEGGRMLDVFTFFSPRAGSRYVTLGAKAEKEEIWDAEWK